MKELKVINILKKMYDTLDDLTEKYGLKQKRVYIWGLSRASYAGLQYLHKIGVDAMAIVENDKGKCGKIPERFIGFCTEGKDYIVDVISPETLLQQYDEKIIFLVFSRYYTDILFQTSQFGYDGSQCIPAYDAMEILNEVNNEFDRTEGLKELDVEQTKQIELNLLKCLREICNKYQLRYYLSAGTLLGAIRHKGFIPWDDDIDIYMPVKDYMKLIEIVKNTNEETYSFLYHGINKNYSWTYLKMQDNNTIMYCMRWPLICYLGVNLDIFPMSGFPGNQKEQEDYKEEVLSFLREWNDYKVQIGLNRDIERDWEKEFFQMLCRYDFDEAPFVGLLLEGCFDREIIHAEAVKETIDVEFEGEYFKAFSGYDEYLTASYGDYMTPPPDWATKKPAHSYRAFLIGEKGK